MVRQLRVRLPNCPGTLDGMVNALAAAGVDMKALQVSERGSGEYGLAQLIVSDLERAVKALEAGGYEFALEEVVIVELEDRVGGLARVLDVLAREQVNVKQLYAFVTRVRGKSLAVLSVDDTPRTVALLEGAGCHLVSQQALRGERRPAPQAGCGDDSLESHLGLDFIW